MSYSQTATCCSICRQTEGTIVLTENLICLQCAHRVIDLVGERERAFEQLMANARESVASNPPRVRSLRDLLAPTVVPGAVPA